MVKSMDPKRYFRPGNGYLAKAKPESEQKNTTKEVRPNAWIEEFSKLRAKGTISNNDIYLSGRIPFAGKSLWSIVKISMFSLKELMTI